MEKIKRKITVQIQLLEDGLAQLIIVELRTFEELYVTLFDHQKILSSYMTDIKNPTLCSHAHLQAHKTNAQKPTCKRASLHPRTGNTLLLLLLALLTVHTNAQPTIPRPVFQTFQPINVPTEQAPNQQQFINQYLNNQVNIAPEIKEQNLRVMQQMGMQVPGLPTPPNKQQQQIDEVHQLLNEEKKDEYVMVLPRFQNYFTLFQKLNPDSCSITKAVYLSEAPFYDNPPPFKVFEGAIRQKASIVKQILKNEGLSTKNGSAVNYAIQKLFLQNNIYHDAKTNKDYVVKKISYDFDDFEGEKDFAKMFVTKLLQTNSGQCHSMPLLYLCIAEQLHAKAYLSLAPNHSYIQFFDNKNVLRNFETTNGHIVSTSWLLQSDAISAMAYKNKTYLDTLSSRKLFAECLADFQNSYIARNDYDNFTNQLSQKILSIDSTNINALMSNSNAALLQLHNLAVKYSNPPQEQLNQYPELLQAYNNSKATQQKVIQTGYQDMPIEQYNAWRNSIDREIQKINNSKNKN